MDLCPQWHNQVFFFIMELNYFFLANGSAPGSLWGGGVGGRTRNMHSVTGVIPAFSLSTKTKELMTQETWPALQAAIKAATLKCSPWAPTSRIRAMTMVRGLQICLCKWALFSDEGAVVVGSGGKCYPTGFVGHSIAVFVTTDGDPGDLFES